MKNNDKLKGLLMDIFLLTEEEFRLDLKREDIDTWDSLGTVSMAVGIQETFGYHFTPEEAMGLSSFSEIIAILESKGVSFHE